jgi:hypothetical protein
LGLNAHQERYINLPVGGSDNQDGRIISEVSKRWMPKDILHRTTPSRITIFITSVSCKTISRAMARAKEATGWIRNGANNWINPFRCTGQ